MTDTNADQATMNANGSQSPQPKNRRPENHEEQQHREVKRWAKTAEFPNPIQWGAVEAEILTRPLPPSSELRPVRDIKLPGALRIYLSYALMVSIPFAGLGVLLAHFFSDDLILGSDWSFAIFFASLAASATHIGTLMKCLETKRWTKWDLLVTSGTTVASSLSYLLMTTLDFKLTDMWFSLSPKWFMLAAAAQGVVTLICLFIFAKPGLKVPKIRRKDMTPSDQYYIGLRASVLETLQKRDLVSTWDISEMVEMPLGTWHQLDERK